MLYQLSLKELWKESVCGHFFQMLPFIFFAANAILFKPRLNDVNFIPESLFCLSRDWATIKATLVKKKYQWRWKDTKYDALCDWSCL